MPICPRLTPSSEQRARAYGTRTRSTASTPPTVTRMEQLIQPSYRGDATICIDTGREAAALCPVSRCERTWSRPTHESNNALICNGLRPQHGKQHRRSRPLLGLFCFPLLCPAGLACRPRLRSLGFERSYSDWRSCRHLGQSRRRGVAGPVQGRMPTAPASHSCRCRAAATTRWPRAAQPRHKRRCPPTDRSHSASSALNRHDGQRPPPQGHCARSRASLLRRPSVALKPARITLSSLHYKIRLDLYKTSSE